VISPAKNVYSYTPTFFFFQFIGLILIGVAAYGKKQATLVSLPALGGVIACGVFLLLIAIIGLIGAIRHNQIILFFVSFQKLNMCLVFLIKINPKTIFIR